MTITTKFKKDISTLKSAVSGDFFLDVRNPKLYKKVRKYYQNEGIEFSGDPLDDYEIIIELVMTYTTIMDQGPYRFVHTDKLLENGKKDFRIQKQDYYTRRYRDMYLLDSQMQMDVCLEDPEYTKWLDPEGVPCYVGDKF